MEILEKNRVNIKNNISQQVFIVQHIFSEDIKNGKDELIAQKGDAIIVNESDVLDKRVFHIKHLLKI